MEIYPEDGNIFNIVKIGSGSRVGSRLSFPERLCDFILLLVEAFITDGKKDANAEKYG
ncbi:hypothetical protein [Roseburia sp. AM51-8]|uniref:hypothetical protein n=1 Tax=Roseburia sp. AM51-8 TaxID=2292366 RepID=UPI001314A44C|nr:hypothetical protein [Roseburia sp. AM51-8]